MPFNNYSKAMESLHALPIEPSFEEIRAQVLTQKRSRKIVLPFWLIFSAIVPMIGLITVLIFPESVGLFRYKNGSHTSTVSSNPFGETAAISSLSRELLLSKPQSKRLANISNSEFFSSNANRSLSKEAEIGERFIQPRHPINENVEKLAAINTLSTEIPLSSTQESIDPEKSIAPAIIELPNQGMEGILSTRPEFTALFCGSYAILPASTSTVNRFPVTLAIRYRVTTSSSLVVEMRRNIFNTPSFAKSTSYHDTILTVGNRQFRNSIGVLTYTPSKSAKEIYTLGIGGHFDLVAVGALQTFAEGIIGSNLQGGLLGGVIGLTYHSIEPLSLETYIRADNFFSGNSSPQRSLSFGVSVGYSW